MLNETSDFKREIKRVLVYGYNGTSFGGIEQVLTEYIREIMDTYDQITFDILVAGNVCGQEKQITEMGCRVLFVPSRSGDTRQYKERIKEVFAQTRYDAVWCNVSGLTNIDVLKSAKKQEIPVRVVHSHVTHLMWGNPIMRFLVPCMHYFNKLRISKYATHYWACSRAAGEFMFPCSVYDQIHVVKNAIDTKLFCPKPEVREKVRNELGFSGLVVGQVARLSQEKNQKFLLQIIRKMVDRDPSVKLLLVGDGDLRKELEAETVQLGLDKSVVFAGFRRDIAHLLQAVDVFVLTSTFEGLGLSAIEAQACGLPCVVSTGVPREVNISGEVSFVSLEDSADHWADAVFEMADKRIKDPVDYVQKTGYQISANIRSIYDVFIGG